RRPQTRIATPRQTWVPSKRRDVEKMFRASPEVDVVVRENGPLSALRRSADVFHEMLVLEVGSLVGNVLAIADQTTGESMVSVKPHRRQPVAGGKTDNLRPLPRKKSIG